MVEFLRAASARLLRAEAAVAARFRQWYYDRLMPWRHFVPVRADMSDLVEKIAWCRGHDGECAAIAAAGRAFAHAVTVEAEIADAARRLQAAEAGSFAAADGAQ